MPTIFLALGSNLGDRQANLQAAVTSLAPGVSLIRQSSVYQTEPWGYTDQPLFLNQVIEARTELPPQDLLAYLKHLEHTLGREATFRYGPRVVDLDILLYGDQVVSLPGLNIPHPRLAERAFVLVPLAELAPDLVHPVEGVTVKELLTRVDASGVQPFSGPAVSTEAGG